MSKLDQKYTISTAMAVQSASENIMAVGRRDFLKTLGVCLTVSSVTVVQSEAVKEEPTAVESSAEYFPWMGP